MSRISCSLFRDSADSFPTKKLISSAAVANASHIPSKCRENSPACICSRNTGISREIQKSSPKESVERIPSVHVHNLRNTTAEKVIWTRYKRLKGFAGPPLSARINVRARVSRLDRKSTRLNSSHRTISYAVFCLKKKKE